MIVEGHPSRFETHERSRPSRSETRKQRVFNRISRVDAIRWFGKVPFGRLYVERSTGDLWIDADALGERIVKRGTHETLRVRGPQVFDRDTSCYCPAILLRDFR